MAQAKDYDRGPAMGAEPYDPARPQTMPFPQIPAPARAPTTRRKLQKAPRQRYRTSPKQPFRTIPLSRSPSTRSDNSRGHLLPSDAQNRHVNFAQRYPPRPNQPSVLRKRRNDSAAGRRTYHTFPHAAQAVHVGPRYPTGYVPQHESPDRYNTLGHEPLLQRVPEQEAITQDAQPEVPPAFPEPELATEHEAPQQPPQQPAVPLSSPLGPVHTSPRHSHAALRPTSWAQRRWTLSEPLLSTSAGPTSRPESEASGRSPEPRRLSLRAEKALPELPGPVPTPAESKRLEVTASSSRDTPAPPPLYTERSSSSFDSYNPLPPRVDSAYHTRLIADFIRDERAYINTLRQSVKNEETFVTSVDLLLSLLSVIQTSDELVSQVESNRTLSGVSSAFLASCGPLDTALMRWSAEIANMGREEEERKEKLQKALPPTPQLEESQGDGPSTSRRGSLLRRVSVLLGRGKSGRRQTGQTPQPKPDRLWQASAGTSAPGLWEMSVLPSQRLTQYRYLLRELLATLPATHPSYSELDRASHGIQFISEKVARSSSQDSSHW